MTYKRSTLTTECIQLYLKKSLPGHMSLQSHSIQINIILRRFSYDTMSDRHNRQTRSSHNSSDWKAKRLNFYPTILHQQKFQTNSRILSLQDIVIVFFFILSEKVISNWYNKQKIINFAIMFSMWMGLKTDWSWRFRFACCYVELPLLSHKQSLARNSNFYPQTRPT